jgi:PAS domain-containing protein
VSSHPQEDEAAVLREARVKAALLASIVDSSDDAITSRRLDGTILSWNPGAERMFGYSAESLRSGRVRISSNSSTWWTLIGASLRCRERDRAG